MPEVKVPMLGNKVIEEKGFKYLKRSKLLKKYKLTNDDWKKLEDMYNEEHIGFNDDDIDD